MFFYIIQSTPYAMIIACQNQIIALDDDIKYYMNNLANVVPIKKFKGEKNDFELLKIMVYLLNL